jgi:hypothetical protein
MPDNSHFSCYLDHLVLLPFLSLDYCILPFSFFVSSFPLLPSLDPSPHIPPRHSYCIRISQSSLACIQRMTPKSLRRRGCMRWDASTRQGPERVGLTCRRVDATDVTPLRINPLRLPFYSWLRCIHVDYTRCCSTTLQGANSGGWQSNMTTGSELYSQNLRVSLVS